MKSKRRVRKKDNLNQERAKLPKELIARASHKRSKKGTRFVKRRTGQEI